MYHRLFVFVEGSDDERFFNRGINDYFKEKYRDIKIIKYANKKEKYEYVDKYIYSIKNMNSKGILADYIYLTDIDNIDEIEKKKENIKDEFKNIELERVIIVVKEIESWYLAGLDKSAMDKIGVSFSGNTNKLTKEKFIKLMPSDFSSKTNFMIEILKKFNFDTAIIKNRSFKYFAKNYILTPIE